VTDVVLKPVDAVLIAERHEDAPGFGPEHMGPIVGRMFGELAEALGRAGIPLAEPAIAYYTANHTGELQARAHVAFPVPPGTTSGDGFDVVELPGADLAATLVHRGTMETIGESWQALLDWIDAAPDIRAIGSSREVYLEAEPRPMTEWVTDLQIPVERTA
jgi:effector-binding domain-containing protein